MNFQNGEAKARVHSLGYGGVAQLGEHLLCTQGVRSSILLISTRRGCGMETGFPKRGLIAQLVRAHD